MKSNPTNQLLFKGHKITLTWIRSSNLYKYLPINQVYGIVFNNNNGILICRKNNRSGWHLPGGTVEANERIRETLIREVLEEVDTILSDIRELGVQKVEFPNNPNKNEGTVFYQARLIAKVKKMLPQTPDPDGGSVWERNFVPASEITNYVNWGKTGQSMFKDAIELHNSTLVN